MSEVADASTQSAVPTAGGLLRQAREQAGLHIGALAVSLKVPVKKLEALESDRLDLLPDAVFARALAASVCRTLKIDAEPVLHLLPEQNKPRLQLDTRLGTAAFDTGMGWRLPLVSRLSKPVAAIAGLLLLAAAVMLFLPALENTAGAPMAVVQGASPVAATSSVVVTTPAPAENSPAPGPVAPVATSAPAQAAAPAQAGASSAVTAVVAPVSTNQAPETPPGGGGMVVFKARATSWVEVTDAAGVVQLRKTLATGETSSASGALPLSVVVGRVDSTEVVVRGKPFDLAPVSKDNVARFQIK